MNHEVKQKWIAALRSGEYQQTTGTLRDGTGFCCLGVLCDVVGSGTWELIEYDKYEYSVEGDFGEAFPPDAVSDAADLHYGQTQVAHMNDSGKTFAEIADYIEEKL